MPKWTWFVDKLQLLIEYILCLLLQISYNSVIEMTTDPSFFIRFFSSREKSNLIATFAFESDFTRTILFDKNHNHSIQLDIFFYSSFIMSFWYLVPFETWITYEFFWRIHLHYFAFDFLKGNRFIWIFKAVFRFLRRLRIFWTWNGILLTLTY